MVHFPMAKLGLLAIKQISKPIIKVIKRTATSNQFFQSYIVTPPAQIYHWIGVRSKMRMLGMRQPKIVPPLNKTMAIETGSDLIGEMFVFTICCSLLLLEFSRQSRNDKRKHDRHKERRELLRNEIEYLSDRVQRQSSEIKDLKYRLSQLGSSF